MYDMTTTILICIGIGALLGLVVGLRKLFLMEQKILNIERHIEGLVKRIEHEEVEIKKKIQA